MVITDDMKDMIFYSQNVCDLGYITLAERSGKLEYLYFGEIKLVGNRKQSPVLSESFNKLEMYLQGALREFNQPYRIFVSDFQQSVLDVVSTIEYGETITYKDVANAIGNPKACRAVGMALKNNPLPLIIPCHRVVTASGKIGGYNGGIPLKEKLLKLEKSSFI